MDVCVVERLRRERERMKSSGGRERGQRKCLEGYQVAACHVCSAVSLPMSILH